MSFPSSRRMFLLSAAAGALSAADNLNMRQIATLSDPAVRESSGLAASRRHPGLYWTMNDSGDGPMLYAFDLKGASHGRWHVPNAKAEDWEALSTGPGNQIYIGDIGDNGRSREEVIVYRIPEPDALSADSRLNRTAPAQAIRLRYADGPHNAEALLVHPRSGDLYIVTKAESKDSDTMVWKAAAPLRINQTIEMKRVAKLALPGQSSLLLFIGLVTGGDISPDGQRVVLCDYMQAYELVLPPDRPFDEIWRQPFHIIRTGKAAQGEAITYRHDGRGFLMTSEGFPCPVFTIDPRVEASPGGLVPSPR